MSPRAAGPGVWGPRWSRWVGAILAFVVYRTKVHGLRRVPRRGPVILVANHSAFIDGPLVHGVVRRRGTHFLITERMFSGFLGVVLRAAGQIPVDQTGRGALTRALAVLRRDGVVGVFPEGTRGNGDITETQGGAAWLAVQTEAAVVPVAIFGTRREGEKPSSWPPLWRRLHVAFGAPFTITKPESVKGAPLVRAAQAEIAAKLRDHVHATSDAVGMAVLTDMPGGERALRGNEGGTKHGN